VARLNADLSRDPGFGANGVVLHSFAVGGDFARALALQSDGRIVTAGFSRPSTTQGSALDDFLVTRHNADGSLDSSFADAGKLVVDYFGASDGAETVAIQPDGRIIAAGLARNGLTNGLAILRTTP